MTNCVQWNLQKRLHLFCANQLRELGGYRTAYLRLPLRIYAKKKRSLFSPEARKHVFGDSAQVGDKPGCTGTEDDKRLESSYGIALLSL